MFAHVTNYDRYRLINLLASYGIREPLLSVFDDIPREMFVDKNYISAAYEDRALPVAHGQSITQPSVIAATLAALGLKDSENILEIGTGTGYQTALLSKLCKKVTSIERIPTLSNIAKANLRKLGILNVELVINDGTDISIHDAEYDAIIINASYKTVPANLIVQLVENGKLIMPVGGRDSQNLSLFTKSEGKLTLERKLMTVRFVPLIGRSGWKQ
jgi:protein-L-isoaspartate(D-aspartate) O-methyltransferase